MNFPSRETVEHIRREYPKGTRIALVRMSDPYSKLKPGDEGSVELVDDAGMIFCHWDCGSSLGVVYGKDEVKKL